MNFIQETILDLMNGDKLIRAFEVFYSSLSEFNQFLFLVGMGIIIIIGLFTIFKKILKMSVGLIRFGLFALILFYLAKMLFNF